MTLREQIEELRLEIAELRGEVEKLARGALTRDDLQRDARSTTSSSIGFGPSRGGFVSMRYGGKPEVRA